MSQKDKDSIRKESLKRLDEGLEADKRAAKNKELLKVVRITMMLLTVVATTLSTILTYYATKGSPKPYSEQMQQLEDTKKSLQGLIQFIEAEQKRAEETEKVVENLKEEHDKMKPVVEADRKVVDAVLSLQEERRSQNVWWDWSVGFVSGVVSSVVASLLVMAGVWLYTKRKVKPGDPAPEIPPVI